MFASPWAPASAPKWRLRPSTRSAPVPLRKVRDEALAAIERKAIADALRYTKGNKAAAARLLEVDVKTLYAKLRLYDLGSPDN